MKAFPAFLLLLFIGFPTLADTNDVQQHFDSLTVGTNTYTNCTFKILNPVEGVVFFGAGGVKIKLSDLQEPERSKFYNTNAAAEFEKLSRQKQAALGNAQFQKAKDQRAAFIKKYHPLRVINDQLYDFSRVFNDAYETKVSDEDIIFRYSDFVVSGKVIQVTDAGLIVENKQIDLPVYLKNYPHEAAMFDGAPIFAYCALAGRHQYMTTTGAQKTILLYDCGRYYDPEKDLFSTKYFINVGVKTKMEVSEFDKVPLEK